MGTVSSMVGAPGERSTYDPMTFEHFLAAVRAQIDARLAWWLESRMADSRNHGPETAAVADAVTQVVLRGGKRMRAALLAAAYEGCGGHGGIDAVAPAGAALELLQGYLLTHDDWMDGDAIRRGGPSVPAMMDARFGGLASQAGITPRRGKSLQDATSVLAGDLASAWALQSLLELTLAPARVLLALREFGRMQEEVVHGQVLDVCAGARNPSEVEAVYALKTASYTVRTPIVMGALLAGADVAQVAALTAFAEPLGIAFQLRDDVLGAFGDTGVTGKPSGSDLRTGKRTALVVEAMRNARAHEFLTPVLDRAEASEDEIAGAIEALEASGARERVEDRIRCLVLESRRALGGAGLTPTGVILLSQALVALTQRDR